MAEVEFNKDDESKVKILDGGDYKEPGGGIRKPTQEEIDSYKIHRIGVMVVFAIVVVVLLLVVVIMIATIDRCEPVTEKKQLPWWKSGVIYNIYPRSFKDSNSDGIGDFQGINDKLKYLKDLGVNILYLSSVFKVATDVDYGYSVIDFKDTNSEYGSLSSFKKLIDSAHQKGLKVIIEFIPNDSSDQHKWFKESLNVSSAKRDWYIWQEDQANNKTNLTGSGSCWGNNTETGRHYLYYCKYGKDGKKADLNWSNKEVQKELESVLGFWLDKGVDGFRVVSVARLFDNLDNSQPSNDVQKIHMVLNKWHNYTTKKNGDSVLIGASHHASMDYYGTTDRPELDIVVNFELVPENNDDMDKFYSATNFQTLIADYLDKIPQGKWPSWALTSWVHKRVASNVSPQLAKSLSVVLLTLPGTPIVFYGDEIGMKDVNVSQDANKSPMQWDKTGGFSDKPSWLKTAGNPTVVNVADDQFKIKEKFKEAVKFRNENQLALLDANLSNFTTTVKQVSVLAYTFKSASDPQFVVIINFSKTTKTVNLSELGGKKGAIKLSTAGKKEKVEMNKVTVTGENALVIKVEK